MGSGDGALGAWISTAPMSQVGGDLYGIIIYVYWCDCPQGGHLQ